VIVVGNTYYVPALASIYYEICLENLDEKHIADELYGGRVPTLWCSYKFGLFYFFREYPTLDLMAVYLGELSE
jgi:hypothetical protein